MKIMKYIVPALLGGMLTLQVEHFLDTKPTKLIRKNWFGGVGLLPMHSYYAHILIFWDYTRFLGRRSDNTKYNSTPKLSGRHVT